MNLTWNKNLSLFKNRFPQLAEMMKSQLDYFSRYAGTEEENSQLCPFWTITNAKDGNLIAAENGLRLHSAYNPLKEAENLLASRSEEISGAKAIVFLGIGLGYSALSAASLMDKTIIILEPDLNHFLGVMLFTDLEKLFHHPSIIFAPGCSTEQAITLINQYGILYSTFISVKAQTAHAQNWFAELETLINRNRNKEDINNATLEKFRNLWFGNSKKNIQKTSLLEGVNLYASKAQDIPFLVLAAGPSLDKILPHLNNLKNKVITVCVDTALKSCLRYNYQPDFIILTDPQYWAWRHIAGLKSPDSILIAENAVYPSVFNFNCKKIICCSSQIPTGQFYEKHISQHGSLGAGGSVASCAWNFAKLAGAKLIFTAGLDLGFPNKQTHIKGSTFEQMSHTNSTKIKSAETAGMPMLFSGNVSIEKDYNGNPLLSDQRMKMFAWWFESRLAACPDVKTYTIAPEGLKIPGISPCSMNNLLELPEISEKKMKFLSIKNELFDVEKKKEAFNKADALFKSQIQEALNISIEAIKNLKSQTPAPQNYQNQLMALEISPILELIPPTNIKSLTLMQRYETSFLAIQKFCKNY